MYVPIYNTNGESAGYLNLGLVQRLNRLHKTNDVLVAYQFHHEKTTIEYCITLEDERRMLRWIGVDVDYPDGP